MLLAANKPNLKKHAPALLGNNWSPENEKRLIAACLAEIEYRPGFVDRSDPPKEAHIDTQDDAVMVPWISERKGILVIDDGTLII